MADHGCANETAPGSAYCAEHPFDDLNFHLHAMAEDMVCSVCKRPVPEGFMQHDCPGPA